MRDDFRVPDVLKRHSDDELRQSIRALPIESMRIDSGSASGIHDPIDRHEWLFVACCNLIELLLRYDEVLRTQPSWGLRPVLPAQEFADAIIPRLIQQLRAQDAPKILPAQAKRIFGLAQAFINAGRETDAIACLEICGCTKWIPAGEVTFLTWMCLHNIAHTSKRREDVIRALKASERIPSDRQADARGAIEWERKQLDA